MIYSSGSQPFVAADPFHYIQNRCGPLRFVNIFSNIDTEKITFGRFLAWAMCTVQCAVHQIATDINSTFMLNSKVSYILMQKPLLRNRYQTMLICLKVTVANERSAVACPEQVSLKAVFF